ncbi:transposase [Bacillus sp. AFS017336]|uniref:transposase n=1 Tax=Bacillus sp. AFS017336 TaxID=2033489 RepID=UPI0035A01CED
MLICLSLNNFLKGIAEVTAVTLVAEIGQFSRSSNPRQLMFYAGLVSNRFIKSVILHSK